MLCDMFDMLSIRGHSKIDVDMSKENPNLAITGMTLPECIISWMRASSDPSRLLNRFQIVAPFVDLKHATKLKVQMTKRIVFFFLKF